MGDVDPKAAKPALPKGAPKDLVDFVDCVAGTVTIKPGKVGWAGKLDLGITEIEPEISFAAGENGGINLTIGSGMVSITLPGSIANGQLAFDTSSLPDAAADFIKKWVGDLNAWLKANGKQFGKATLDKGAVTLTKAALAPAKQADPAVKAPYESLVDPVPPPGIAKPELARLIGMVLFVVFFVLIGIAVFGGKLLAPAPAGSPGGTEPVGLSTIAPTVALSTTTPGINCSGPYVMFVDQFYPDAVFNGALPTKVSTQGKSYCLHEIATYHWNGGKGAAAGGTITLRDSSGQIVGQGPWKADAAPATNNVPADWEAIITELPPVVVNGSYTVEDSDPATWSASKSSDKSGFVRMWGQAETPVAPAGSTP